jgi:hypothetical protein
MESPRQLTLVSNPEPPETVVPDEVRLTGKAARLAEQANLRALDAAIDAYCA